jgi:hypothetical protein
VTNQWNGGFQGAIDIPITTAVNGGWTAQIQFNRAVTIDVSDALSKEICLAHDPFLLGLDW